MQGGGGVQEDAECQREGTEARKHRRRGVKHRRHRVAAAMRGRTKYPVGQRNATSCSAYEPFLIAFIQVNTKQVCAACTGVPLYSRDPLAIR